LKKHHALSRDSLRHNIALHHQQVPGPRHLIRAGRASSGPVGGNARALVMASQRMIGAVGTDTRAICCALNIWEPRPIGATHFHGKPRARRAYKIARHDAIALRFAALRPLAHSFDGGWSAPGSGDRSADHQQEEKRRHQQRLLPMHSRIAGAEGKSLPPWVRLPSGPGRRIERRAREVRGAFRLRRRGPGAPVPRSARRRPGASARGAARGPAGPVGPTPGTRPGKCLSPAHLYSFFHHWGEASGEAPQHRHHDGGQRGCLPGRLRDGSDAARAALPASPARVSSLASRTVLGWRVRTPERWPVAISGKQRQKTHEPF